VTIGREGTPPRHVHGRRVQGGEGTVVGVMRTAKHEHGEFVAADCVQPARHGAGEGTTTVIERSREPQGKKTVKVKERVDKE